MTLLHRVSLGSLSLQVLDKGEGPVLLLVHGFPLDHTMWRKQLEGLATNCRIIAPDLPGFGGSDARPEPVLTMRRMADDLAEMLDVLQIRQPITFCGLSMGGYIALEFWKRHAQRLERLILCDTRAAADSPDAAEGRRTAAAEVLRQGTKELAASMSDRLFADATRSAQPDLIEQTGRVMSAARPATVSAALLGMAERDDLRELLPSIRIPTLVVCGEQDRITPIDEMRAMALALPEARFVEVPGAGHMAPLEQGELVNGAIREFLDVS